MNILRFLTPKSQVIFLEDHDSVRGGLEKLRHRGYTAVPVIRKTGEYVGTVTEGDFLRYLLEHPEQSAREMEKVSIGTLVRDGWNLPVNASASVEDLLSRLMCQNFVPVVDDRGVFVGIVTRKSILGNVVMKET